MSERESRLRIFSNRETTVDHYPIHAGHVVVRWRGSDDPDGCGYIVEANIGGVIVEGSGHYGDSLYNAQVAGKRIVAALRATGEPTTDREG